ncbi:hypothetical protein DAI22_04g286700 [Oryza sativa Japonica Group]|nr:hypothetical protein DAI22_04g286700 [Oryza sativa Japonica Group]
MEEGDEDKDTKVDGREKKVTRILAMTHVPADTDAAYWLTGLWTRGSNLALSRILAIRMRGESCDAVMKSRFSSRVFA